MPVSFPGQYNTKVPAASTGLVVDYSRNPAEFRLSDWWEYKPVDLNVGLYPVMTVEQAGRVTDAEGADALWSDGLPRPSNNNELESFEWHPYRTRRFERGFNVGKITSEEAEWDVIAQNARIQAQRLMTLRTTICVNYALTSSRYLASHVIPDITAVAGITGKLDLSTVARSDIKRLFDYMAQLIHKQTLGAVKPSQCMVVMGPEAARRLAVVAEIREYLQQQQGSEKLVTGNLGQVDNYGLPDTLYDYPVVVEDCVRVTTRKGAATTKAYVFPTTAIIMCARPGELEGLDNAPTFSTFSLMLQEELQVESEDDSWNRRSKGSVVDQFDPVMTAQLTGVLAQNPLT
jgi:hypothetical protein